MKKIAIAGTDIACSKFIFGTASLFNAGDERERAALLAAAADHGFTHCDTAPRYGFGMAERDLAPLLRAHPNLTVTTKVGLYPPGGTEQSARCIFLRKFAGKLLPPLSRPIKSFDLSRAEQALVGSLKRLGRDHIDIYMLHEPERGLVDVDAWVNWLQGRQAAGQIRHFGIALPDAHIAPFLSDESGIAPVIQTIDSLDEKQADCVIAAGRPLQFTYGYMSAARQRGDARPAREILGDAIRRNATGAILVSTTKAERVGQYAAIAGDAE
ncbi:hypothetical protein BH10PSE13_BH10PSE13_05210 [soil metagenome]